MRLSNKHKMIQSEGKERKKEKIKTLLNKIKKVRAGTQYIIISYVLFTFRESDYKLFPQNYFFFFPFDFVLFCDLFLSISNGPKKINGGKKNRFTSLIIWRRW